MAGQTRIDGNLIDTGTDPNDIVSVSVGDARYPRLSQDNTLAGNLTVDGDLNLMATGAGIGVFTIAAPDSNTNRTLTLPDEVGKLLTDSGALNVDPSAPTQSVTIDPSGDFLVGTTTSSVTTEQGIVLNPSQGFLANNSTTSGGVSLILLYSSFSSPDETKFEVTSEGNVKSRTNSYAGFSDERLKQNITPSASQWNDVKNIEVVKFQMKSEQFSDEENPWMLGVTAQKVEKTSPGLVEEDPKDGMKSVKYSILYMKAVKALQEAMERIEALEAEMAELKGKSA